MMRILQMNLTGIYKNGEKNTGPEKICLDLSDMEGTRGYCSEEAAEEIRRRIRLYPACGIHFLDSGNYHYLTKFWLEKISKPFFLMVFDHHTDMQRSAFGDILSCGSWIYDVMVNNQLLQKVILIGTDPSFLPAVDPACEGKYIWIPDTGEDTVRKVSDILYQWDAKNLYVSIDKDVLSPEELTTDWDQGTMRISTMVQILQKTGEMSQMIGADVCGEPDAYASEEIIRQSEKINIRLAEVLSAVMEEH